MGVCAGVIFHYDGLDSQPFLLQSSELRQTREWTVMTDYLTWPTRRRRRFIGLADIAKCFDTLEGRVVIDRVKLRAPGWQSR